jgi:hypothetical protein
VENVLLLVLDEGPGSGVDNAFRRASGARGVEDVERMRRRKLGELQRLGRKWPPRGVSSLVNTREACLKQLKILIILRKPISRTTSSGTPHMSKLLHP